MIGPDDSVNTPSDPRLNTRQISAATNRTIISDKELLLCSSGEECHILWLQRCDSQQHLKAVIWSCHRPLLASMRVDVSAGRRASVFHTRVRNTCRGIQEVWAKWWRTESGCWQGLSEVGWLLCSSAGRLMRGGECPFDAVPSTEEVQEGGTCLDV